MPHDQQQSSTKLELIFQVGRALNSTIDMDALLHVVASRVAALLEADRCSIFVVDRESKSLWTRASLGHKRIEVPFSAGLVGAVATSGTPVNVPDAYADPRFNPQIDAASGYHTKTVLGAPMFTIQGELIGVLQVINKTNGTFTPEDEQTLLSIAGFAANALQNTILFDQLRHTFFSFIEVMAATIDAKHKYTAGHTSRVAAYSCGIARRLGFPQTEIEVLRVAAYLHDYGKIAIPDHILQKPGRLDPDEFESMKSHAEKTRILLSKMSFSHHFKDVPMVASSHHERFDGTGYPLGLKGEAIPLGARVMAFADVFDAITSDRDYRKAMPASEAFDLIKSQVGTAFDPDIFPAFEEYFRIDLGQQPLHFNSPHT